jgi:NAD(P)H-hydrate epimerase
MLTLTCDQIRLVDKLAIEDYAMPSIILMENAARNAAEIIKRKFADLPHPTTTIFCGPGNNGGDGFAIARHLHNANWQVKIVLAVPAEKLKGDALINYTIDQKMNLPILSAEETDRVLADTDVVIDALLGTGATGEPRPAMAAIIQKIEAAGKPVVAIDVPSGFDCSSGQPAQTAIHARFTVTFVAIKDTFLQPNAKVHTGEIHVSDIGAPRQVVEQVRNAK